MVGTIWRNNKTKRLYRVFGVAGDCSEGRDGVLVVLYGDEDIEFVRERNEFLAKFTRVVEVRANAKAKY